MATRPLRCFLAATAMLSAGCAKPPEPSSPPPLPAPAPMEGASSQPVSQGPLLSPAASGGPTPPLAQGWQAMGSELEGKLFETTLHAWREASQCTQFDYFPRGGIQSFWCHRPIDLTPRKVSELAGVALFTSGPHQPDSLKLDSPHSFGHYDPAFVRWLLEQASPAARGTPAQRATQEAYDRHMRPLAEVFFRTYEKTRSDPACFARERSLYEAGIKRRTLPRGYYERWFYFMNPSFCTGDASRHLSSRDGGFKYFSSRGFDGGVDGNVTKTAVGFWLRRSIDGTLPLFAEGLTKLISAYQPDLLPPLRSWLPERFGG